MKSGVYGAGDVASKLRALAASMTPAVRRKARQAGLKPILDDAVTFIQANVSVESRALIGAVAVAEERRNTSVVGIRHGRRGRLNRNPARTAHLVEFGTAPHWQPNRFGGIMHPGAKPYPFMRPALEKNRLLAAQLYAETALGAVLATAARLGTIRRS